MSSTTALETSSRDRVLLAAQQLIIDHGRVDFSMRELAEVSGLAKATIYHHFPDKQTICRSVVEIELASLRDRIARAAQSATDPKERLGAVIHELFGPQLERRLVILIGVREVSGLPVQFQDVLIKYRNDLVAPIAEIISDGIEQGMFRSVNVEMTVISLMGMMQSYVTHRILFDPEGFAESIADHTVDLLLNGLAKGAAQSR